MTSWDQRPVVITVAPTGSAISRADNPNIPYTPREIADHAIAAAAHGATVAHLHVREDDGTPSARAELWNELLGLLHAESDLVTMASTGGGTRMSLAQRAAGLGAGAAVAGVETGSLNFGDEEFVTTRPQALEIVDRATTAGVRLEVEAFEVGHVVQAIRMLEVGELPTGTPLNLVFGVRGSIDATPEGLAAMIRPIPAGHHWTVTCIGRQQFRMLGLAVLNGAGGIRIGLEDAIWLDRGVLSQSSAQFAGRARNLVETLGRRVATPDEARRAYGLPLAAPASAG